MRERKRISTATYHRASRYFDVVPTSPAVTIEAHVNQRILSVTINAERTVEQLARHIEHIYKQEHPCAIALSAPASTRSDSNLVRL